MMESENYPLAAITVTVCGQERLMDTKTSRCKYLVITKEKQFFREKPARHPLNQVIKVNNQIMRQVLCYLECCIDSIIPDQNAKPKFNHGKHQAVGKLNKVTVL